MRVSIKFHSKPAYVAATSGAVRPRRQGLTLIELMVVLVIVTATALIVIPSITLSIDTPTKSAVSPSEIVTQTTLNVVRDALIGKDGVLENLAHNPEVMPLKISELLDAAPPERMQQIAPELSKHDPLIGIGWRGPYMLPTGRNALGFPAIVDGWGNEIHLQVDFNGNGKIDPEECQYLRIVSPGPNGIVETPMEKSKMKPGSNGANELTLQDCGDDVVLFIRVPDSRQ